jgi:hypothetical protein
LSLTLAAASFVSDAAICVKFASLFFGSATSVTTLPELSSGAPPPKAAEPPFGFPGSVEPPSVESSSRTPWAEIVLAAPIFTKTLLTCSFEFDVLPCPITASVCVPLAAPSVSEWTFAPLLFGSAVPMLQGTTLTVYVPGTVMQTSSVDEGMLPVLQLAPTPQSPLAAFAQLSVQALATAGETRKQIRPKAATITANRRRAPRLRPRATVGSSITICFESSRADRTRQ